MSFEPDNFDEALSSLTTKFGLKAPFDLKTEPYHVIAYYQAISVRKIELTIQTLVAEIKNLNSKLDNIKNQMSSNATTIADAIDDLH